MTRAKRSIDDRKSDLADRLLADMEKLRKQLFSPVVEKVAKVVSVGGNAGSVVEVVEIELPEPSFASKRLIVAAIAEGIEKVVELTGAGSRNDVDDDWTAPAGTTSIRDAPKRGAGHVRPAGGAGRAADGARADAASAAHLGRSS